MSGFCAHDWIVLADGLVVCRRCLVEADGEVAALVAADRVLETAAARELAAEGRAEYEGNPALDLRVTTLRQARLPMRDDERDRRRRRHRPRAWTWGEVIVTVGMVVILAALAALSLTVAIEAIL